MSSLAFAEFVWIWNAVNGQGTPHLHLTMARWLAERWEQGDRHLLLKAFRNSGKSTLVGLFSAWLLLRDPNLRILILAADFALAKKMARNVRRIIERHPAARFLKPSKTDQWASDQFTVTRSAELRDPSVLAKGMDANITGLRADIVICDDVEVPNTCDTPAKRMDLRQRLAEIDYVLVPGGLQLYVGTPHSFYTIYSTNRSTKPEEDTPFLSGFQQLELPILNEQQQSIWPERFPLDLIDQIRQRTGPSKFESQMMLRPRNIADGRLDPDRLKSYNAELVFTEGNGQAILTLADRRLVSVSAWWDPAYGSLSSGDASVVAAVFTDDQGDYWLHGLDYLTHDTSLFDQVDEATQLCRQVSQFVQRLHLPALYLETNGLGRFLPGLLRQQLQRSGDRCAVLEKTSTRNKDLRIIDAFEAVLAARRLWAHRRLWDTPFIEEMREWRPGQNGRDDALDAVSGCLLAEPVRLAKQRPHSSIAGKSRKEWRPGAQASKISHDFSPLNY